MSNLPCLTYCPNCGEDVNFYLSNLHEGRRCQGCKKIIIQPTDFSFRENYILMVSYKKLYATKKEGYGTIIRFIHSCIHGKWTKSGKCEHEKKSSFIMPIGEKIPTKLQDCENKK